MLSISVSEEAFHTNRGLLHGAILGLRRLKCLSVAYEGVLKDEEIVAVLSWIKSRWPASIREKHDQLNAQSLRTPGR